MHRGDSREGGTPRGPARPPDQERLRRELTVYMEKQGLRSTEQRRAIVDSFFASPGHVTLEQLLEQARVTDPRVGYATVYRTMKLLAEAGIAHERKFGDGLTRYELADDAAHHDHLICVLCGSIEEFEEPEIEEIQARLARRHGFEVHHHKHELYGRCARCAASAARPR